MLLIAHLAPQLPLRAQLTRDSETRNLESR